MEHNTQHPDNHSKLCTMQCTFREREFILQGNTCFAELYEYDDGGGTHVADFNNLTFDSVRFYTEVYDAIVKWCDEYDKTNCEPYRGEIYSGVDYYFTKGKLL